MKKISKFQIIVLAVFGIGIVTGLAALALSKNKTTSTTLPPVVIWGVLPQQTMDSYISAVNLGRGESLSVTYVEKSIQTIQSELVEELALGKGPDAILIPQELLYGFQNKLVAIPYTAISARDYKNVFIEQAELYLKPEGLVGMPFMIDPMVMYWNRDIFTTVGIASYPKTWEDVVAAIPRITQKDVNANIRRATLALGEFNNVANARDVFSMILLQSGNPITYNYVSTLGGQYSTLTENATNFFIGFSNPSSPGYTWNRSLPRSDQYFLSGNLGLYFGYASELGDIREKNPNLNFDIAPIPQPKNARQRIDYARMYGFSIVKSSKNPVGAYSVLSELTSGASLSKLMSMTYLPPVRRDMIAAGNTDPYLSIFYDSALISHGFIDPNPFRSNAIFQNLVESVTSGRDTVYGAISTAHNELNLLFK